MANAEVTETLRKIKKYLECPICLELLSDPYTTQCGHSFCRQCIHTFIASTKHTKCPLCKVAITKRSMNKSACLSDIIESVRSLEEAVQKDIGVTNTPPCATLHSHECSATPGLIIHSLLHPTPFKPTTMPQASGMTEMSTPPVIQRKTRSNIRKTNNRRQKKRQNITRNATEDITNSSGSSSCALLTVAHVSEDQPSTSSNVMMTSHVDDAPNEVVTAMVSSPVEDCLDNLREQDGDDNDQITSVMEQGGVEQQDVLSVALFTSSSNDPGVIDRNSSPASVLMDNLLEEELPTPVLQQDDPLCSSTPDKMEYGSLEARHMSRSPSIPLQNVPAKVTEVGVTPVVLPPRMIALEGLYSEESTDSDHGGHDSLDLFDDAVIPSSQSKGDQNLAAVSPALISTDQHSSVPSHHVDTVIVNTPSLSNSAIGDSISTQEIMRLQQELEQKQNEIASLDAAIQEKSIQNIDDMATVCSKGNQSSFTLPSSVETINDSLLTSRAQQVQSPSCQSPMITPNTQMNTMALFHCADQILSGLKKTLKKERALAPIDTNVTTGHSTCITDKDKLFHTPVHHHVHMTRPYSDQPRHNKMSLLKNQRLNYSAELIPSDVATITTSGLTLSEIEKVQRLAEVCCVQYSNRLSSDTTHLVMATSNDKICSRTPKYLQGLLRGLWIITYDWVVESLKAGVLVDEVDHEVMGDTMCALNVPRRARMAKLRKSDEILASHTVALIGEMKEMGTRAVTSLILLAGGIPSHTSLTDINKECEDGVIMMCDPSGLEDHDLDVIRSNSLNIVNMDWLLDSISCYKMQSFDDYLVK